MLIIVILRPRTHGNVFLRFCIVSSNELVVLDSREKTIQKTQENVSVCTGHKFHFETNVFPPIIIIFIY